MTSTPPPSYYEPSLTNTRLRRLAMEILEIRNHVADKVFDTELDDSWGTACLAYSRCRRRFIRLAERELEWLRVQTHHGQDATLLVGDVAVRFYPGDENKTKSKHVAATLAEQVALREAQLSLPGLDLTSESTNVWHLIVPREDSTTTRSKRVMLVRADTDGEVLEHWNVLEDLAGDVVQLLQPPRRSERPPTKRKQRHDTSVTGDASGDED